MRIVVNRCYGGFSLSEKAFKEMGINWDGYGFIEVPRNDPKLVEVVEKLGKEANGMCAQLEIVDIPNDVEWEINEYDGYEWVAEKHRRW